MTDILTPQKIEWINFITTNITALGSNVYPAFSDIEQNADTFCVVEVNVLSHEKMESGSMYSGYVRLTFVAPTPKVLDHTLIDKFGDELELKYRQFIKQTVMGIKNISPTEKYKPEIENMLKREVDVGVKWYVGS
jgi:hypothetical protein